MNSGKGIPRRALEILTFMYDCGLSRRQTVATPSPEKEKKLWESFFFFSYVNFSQVIQDIFFKEWGKQVLFFALLWPPSDTQSTCKRFEGLQRAAGLYGHSRRKSGGERRTEMITCIIEMASNLLRVYFGLASAWGLNFDIWGSSAVTLPRAIAPGLGRATWTFWCHFAPPLERFCFLTRPAVTVTVVESKEVPSWYWQSSSPMASTPGCVCVGARGECKISALTCHLIFCSISSGFWTGTQLACFGPWEIGLNHQIPCEESCWRFRPEQERNPGSKSLLNSADHRIVGGTLLSIRTAKWNFPMPNPG